MKFYDLSARTAEGKEKSMEDYKGKVVVVVNTASKCGFTPQYEDLEKLYKEYKTQGFEVLGFPSNQFMEQEPGNNEEIQQFCKLNYGVSFQIFDKTDVRGKDSHEIFKYLSDNSKFEGFDMNHPTAKVLDSILKEKYPEFLLDDGVKWNFTKFLIDREGNIKGRFEPTTSPLDMKEAIENLL